MKVIVYRLILVIMLTAGDVLAQHHGFMNINGREKDPATAALLSIQPCPVALGNFYTNNWERGIIYSTVEVALFIPAAILLGRNNWGMGMYHHSNGYSNDKRWTSGEHTQFNYLLAGYILVKVVSAFDAGYSAENFNNHLSMKYDTDIDTAVLSLNIPL